MKSIEQRIELEISDANPFLFANTRTSLDHAVGWQCIKAVIKMMGSGLEKPDLLIADKFRHRLSTLYAVLELPANEREAFYRHMGHSEAINKHVYKCPLAIGEIVNVGGFLKAVHDPPSCKLPVPRKTSPTIFSVGAVNELPPPTENNGHDHIETEDDIQNPTP